MCKKLLNSLLCWSLSLHMEKNVAYQELYIHTQFLYQRYTWAIFLNDKLAFLDIILYAAGKQGDLFILIIKTEPNVKKPIWFILLRNDFLQKENEAAFPFNVYSYLFQWADSIGDKQLPFSGARSKLEQWLQNPLDYMLVHSESIAIWTFSSRPLAYKSNWGIVSWMHTHMSICLHSLVPAQTFVKSLPYHAWSQRTMNKAQQ